MLRPFSFRLRQGFTLIELAITMSIMGLILSATWVAASSVYDNMNISTTLNNVTILSENIRDFYKSQTAFSKSTGTEITSTLVSADLFPPEMINSHTNLPITPWGTNIKVYVGASKDSFRIELAEKLPEGICRSFVGRLGGKGRASSITNITVGSTSYASSDGLNNLTAISFGGTCTSLSITFALKG